MRPAMSDSLISGQPLYLVYWYSNFLVPAGKDPLLTLRATHATGSVRLHVTGSPPTTSASGPLFEQPTAPKGTAAAASPRSNHRRVNAAPANFAHPSLNQSILHD